MAERIRALVNGRYGERINEAAVGLGVGERELATLLQGRVPAERADGLAAVLTRVVRHFGVDPSWLVTGRYDVHSHVAAEEHRADMISLRFQIHRLLSGPDWSVAMAPVKRADQIAADEPPRSEWTQESPSSYDPKAESDNGRRGQGGEPDR